MPPHPEKQINDVDRAGGAELRRLGSPKVRGVGLFVGVVRLLDLEEARLLGARGHVVRIAGAAARIGMRRCLTAVR